MLFPIDPDKRPELWPSFVEKISTRYISLIVHGGQWLLDDECALPIADNVNDVLGSFKSADIAIFFFKPWRCNRAVLCVQI